MRGKNPKKDDVARYLISAPGFGNLAVIGAGGEAAAEKVARKILGKPGQPYAGPMTIQKDVRAFQKIFGGQNNLRTERVS